jgi:hypothetical protein
MPPAPPPAGIPGVAGTAPQPLLGGSPM